MRRRQQMAEIDLAGALPLLDRAQATNETPALLTSARAIALGFSLKLLTVAVPWRGPSTVATAVQRAQRRCAFA